MKNTVFYEVANQALREENQRLLSYTNALDENPEAKKAQIAEYKCAKYRYAAISNVHSRLQLCHRLRDRLADTHFVIAAVDEILCRRQDLLARYEKAEAADRAAVGLYCGMVALTDGMIAECEARLTAANDWEAVELTERLGGYRYARECLEEAWRAWEDGR